MSFVAHVRFLLVSLVMLPLVARGDSVVTFHEVHYNPTGSQDAEWVELHNQMAVDIDLSGWSLADGIEFSFPPGTVLAAGGYLVVAKSPGDASLAGVPGVIGPFSGNLSNGGESIELRSASGRVMDRLEYGDAGEWPVAADGAGATLAKREPGAASGLATSWTSSRRPAGTPGRENFTPPGQVILHDLAGDSSTWSYSDTNVAPPPGWQDVGFNDAAWPTGQPVFGTSGTPPVLLVTDSLVQRHRADDITGTPDGSTFTTWSDTATGDGLSQNTSAGGNPTFVQNATPTFLPVVRFDGDDEFRATIAPGIAPSSGFAYFIVCKARVAPDNGSITGGDGDYIFDRDASVNETPLVSLKAVNNRFGFQKRDDGAGGLGGPVSTTTISTTQFQIIAVRRNPAQSRFEIWVDGTMENSVPDEGDNLTPPPVNLGRHATSVSQGFDGDIAEVLIFRDALTENDFQSVGAYLEARHGIDTAFPNTTVRTTISSATPTSYFRKAFTFTGDPSRTALRLNHLVADGAVFYLNGQEISRTNLPAGTIGHATAALADVAQPASTGFFNVPASALASGSNVLAVSLHRAADGIDARFSASLEASESPPESINPPRLRLNELAATTAVEFFLELHNPEAGVLATAGYTVSVPGGASFSLPASSIPPGSRMVLTESQLGFRPAAGDKVVLFAPDGSIADVQVAGALPGARDETSSDRWLRPLASTPGSPNQFALATDIVINEICYKAPDLPPVPGTTPVESTLSLLDFSRAWRYQQSGANLGTDWAATAHPVGGAWANGTAPFGYSRNALPLALNTTLVNPRNNSPFVVTYYFETDFNLTAEQAGGLRSFTFRHFLDDGAVIYLNGVELTRINMPATAISAGIFAIPGVATAVVSGPIVVDVPTGTAVGGVNRISVEVHQASTNSSDVAFALEASATITTGTDEPAIPARPSDQEWIELHNKGGQTVDLSGWKFDTGVQYTFPAATTIPAGGYLVVARDPALVTGSQSAVLGPWSGGLSGQGERVRLVDASGNPADEVAYFDGGRWPDAADGGGATLELRDPRADNNLAESWAASDESARRTWQSFTYEGVATASAVGPDNQWREFIFGLLDAGEVLLDDITVTENPGGAAVAMITGGDFESGTSAWRFLGNHGDAAIIPDPANPANQVLRLRASGATEHMHNHVETTLANGLSVVNGRTYRINFRAMWISGCNKLNTRLYFNRLARVTAMDRPQAMGTPGAANSHVVANAGPGVTAFTHHPVVPRPGEAVTVTAMMDDPDGVGAVTLYHSVAGGAYAATPMTLDSGGQWSAVLPGQASGAVVRMYLEAHDAAAIAARSWYPAAGPESHALYQVDDGLAATNGLHNIRIIMEPAGKELLYRPNNVMSNGRIGCTVIYRESEIFYNAGVRLKSSQRGRQNASRVGFNLSFNDDQLFRGVHQTIAIDRSEGQVVGAQEILYDHMMYASGGIPAECNDLVKVIAPDPAHTSTAILQMARFGPLFLESQFDQGEDGTVYEYELVYYPTTTDAGGYKLPQPDDVVGADVTSLGADKEAYRWTYLTKNNEDKDDYAGVMAMAGLFDLPDAEFHAAVDGILDVDQWLRALAYSCATGAGDSFFSNANHNGQFYARPSDGRMLYFPHDLDFAYNATMDIFTSTELQRLTVDPARRRLYLGHLHHICTTVFNSGYMADWTSHYGGLLPGENFAGHLSYINTRSNFILSSINSQIAPTGFAITTNGGANFTTDDTPVTLAGSGWVNVRSIRLAGGTSPLVVRWTSGTAWETAVAVGSGANTITLEAVDFSGQVVGTDSVTITHSGADLLPAANNLVVSKIYYNPLVANDTSEFIELMNISAVATVDLSGLAFTDGIAFTFPGGVKLDPGERIMVVRNTAAFATEFGSGHRVAGVFTGALDNAGETVTLQRADNTLVRTFAYSDDPPWPVIADTLGHAIVLVDPFSNPDHNDPLNWRASLNPGGAPGVPDGTGYEAWKADYGNPDDGDDDDGDGFTTRVEYLLGGNPLLADPGLRPGFGMEPGGQAMLVSITRRADASGLNLVPQSSGDLRDWLTPPGMTFLSNSRLPGSPARDRLSFRIPVPAGAARQFVRFAIP